MNMKNYTNIKNDLFSIVEIQRTKKKYIKIIIVGILFISLLYNCIFTYLLDFNVEITIGIYIAGIFIIEFIIYNKLDIEFWSRYIIYKIKFTSFIPFYFINEMADALIILNELNKKEESKSKEVLAYNKIFCECTKYFPPESRYSKNSNIIDMYNTYFNENDVYGCCYCTTKNFYLYKKILKFILDGKTYKDCNKLNGLLERYIDIIYQLIKDQETLDIDNTENIERITDNFVNTGTKIIKAYEENKLKEKEIRSIQYNKRMNDELDKVILTLNSIEKDLDSYN